MIVKYTVHEYAGTKVNFNATITDPVLVYCIEAYLPAGLKLTNLVLPYNLDEIGITITEVIQETK